MSKYSSKSFQGNASSNALLGAALSDGMLAGFIGGILGLVIPILGMFTGNNSTVAIAAIADIVLYFITGILSGYLFYSRKIGRGLVVIASGILGGLMAGTISGVALGFSAARLPQLSQVDSNTLWAMWGIIGGLGAAFIGAITSWIPGLFFRSDTEIYSQNKAVTATNEKELSQLEQVGQRFKRRMKTRLIVGIASIALVFACYFCQTLIQ